MPSTEETPLSPPPASSSPYEEHRRVGLEAVRTGDLESALAAFDRSLSAAEALGDQRLIDRATCNRSLVAIELGRHGDCVRLLQEILTRSQDRENRRLAAYHVARVHELDKGFKKALFYARIALDLSRELERADWIASSHNQIGDLLLAESHVEDATAAYEVALSQLHEDESLRRAQILDNLGYCRILQERVVEGFRLLHESCRALRRLGARRYAVSVHLDLCFAHLQVERPHHAVRYGRLALSGARELGLHDIEKNALYLLGQALLQTGRHAEAREIFADLERLFPGSSNLIPLFLSVDLRQVINLRA